MKTKIGNYYKSTPFWKWLLAISVPVLGLIIMDLTVGLPNLWENQSCLPFIGC